MNILLAFAPFITFALVQHLAGPIPGLFAGALVSLGLLLRDALRGRSPKVLEIGTCLLFAALTALAVWGGATWSLIGVRLCVDAGLLLVVLMTMAIGKPFTLQYAREQVPETLWASPRFVRTNYVISGAWAAAFAVMVVAEAAMLYLPQLPPHLGTLTIVLALVAAFKFTGWYPAHVQQSARAAG